MLNLVCNLVVYFGSVVLILGNSIIKFGIKLHTTLNTKNGKKIKEYNAALKEMELQLKKKQAEVPQKDRYSRLADILKGE
jgi:hypothetical protein